MQIKRVVRTSGQFRAGPLGRVVPDKGVGLEVPSPRMDRPRQGVWRRSETCGLAKGDRVALNR